jgi:CelD/BcsL family acetyltransferase involved in cellulose biosynthesis
MVTNSEAMEAAHSYAPKARSSDLAIVEVFNDPQAIRSEWDELYAAAVVSPYQSFLFLSVWAETMGREHGLEPVIVVARNAAGSPRAIAPLAVDTRGPLRIGTFLGGRESNFNLALIHPDARLDEDDMHALLFEAARQAPNGIDLFYLRNQPKRFDGRENPLAFKCARPSASAAFGVTLPKTQEELAARMSKETRKKLRRKEAKLAELGEIRYEHRAKDERARVILRALIDQKSARFANMGIDGLFSSVGMKELARRLSEANGDGAMELHALSVGDRVVATYAGFVRGGRFSAMLNSFDLDETIARSSPGDLLLHALMRDLVQRGMTHFDLGAGEARYKNAVCNETIELCDAVAPMTWKGAAAAPFLFLFLLAKRRVKQSPALSRAYAQIRKALRGL